MQAQGRTEDLKAARKGSVAGSAAAAGLEESHWLCPIEDRRSLGSLREGMLEGFSLGSYLLLVDYTSRLFREGKAAISRELAEILERVGTTADTWQARLCKCRSRATAAGQAGVQYQRRREELLARRRAAETADAPTSQ